MKKTTLTLAALAALLLAGCNNNGYYGGPYVPPAIVPGYAWIGPGYYGGYYYGTSADYYGSTYYRTVTGTAYHGTFV